MRGAAAGLEPQSQNAAGCAAQAVVGRLAVDQEPRSTGAFVGDHGAIAAAFLAYDEQHSDAALARCAQPFRRRDLRRQDPLGVARAAAEQRGAAKVAREEWWNAVEMRREDDGRLIESCEHVESAVAHGLPLDGVPELRQPGRQPLACRLLPAGRGIDVDQLAREGDGRYRIHDSSAVRALVRSSRYFTITGVATEIPHSRPRPLVTGRDPGTTTAPSGTMTGCPATGSMIRSLGRS